jgi:4'-phosphopantetheinyl transferase
MENRHGSTCAHDLTRWSSPPQVVAFGRADLHLWKVDLDCPRFDVEVASRLLSPTEIARAQRFHFSRDSRRFIIARALLRIILAGYVGCPPGELRVGRSRAGKPFLRGVTAPPHFNVSHSASVAVFAFARRRFVGVDVERVRDLPDLEQVAARFFSTAEAATLALLYGERRVRAFFACWTRKEAYLKAIGTGLAGPLDRFTVSMLADESPRLVWVADDPSAPLRWSLTAFSVGPRYVGAAVVNGTPLVCSHWSAERLAHSLIETARGTAGRSNRTA